ncbi:MAG TPA: alpha/beta hydrolase [Ktedonobacteraceae bacterium]|nr:alpha/beta hydrolase [Ktedonobacteraceae bacterium]
MSQQTMRAFNLHLMKLYAAKEYAQALEQVEQEKANFPENLWEIAYWRICLQALLGEQTEALQSFQEILDLGLWFSPNRLARELDMDSLRPLPEFQKMTEVCQQRFEKIRPTVRPELLVEQTANRATALPLLIALHGNGENASVTIDYWREATSQGWLLALPQSSQIYDPNSFVWDDREIGINEIRAHLASLRREQALDQERVVLGGFSMGGGQAVWMALRQLIKTRGFIVLAPYLTPAELEALPALLESQKPAALRGCILVGEEDVECLEVSRKLVEIMRACNLPGELEVHPGEDHDYPPNFAEFVSKGLAFIEADTYSQPS